MTKQDQRHALSVSRYRDEIFAGNRIVLSQAITLSESTLARDQSATADLMDAILSRTGHSIRVGITGVPGVGKSTFIETFGKLLTTSGKRVAILTIDPTSQKTKGSILGDKTRMEELSRDPLAFIRPTPSGSATGGVGDATRESILLCEAAGFEIIIIETVGVGQSEVTVRSMVDFFLLLMLAGAGDELQGIKKGIMEMADGIAITKADGGNLSNALQAKNDCVNALHLFQPPSSGVRPTVLITSAREKKGIGETWQMVEDFVKRTTASGFFEEQRMQQQIEWFRNTLNKLISAKWSHAVMSELGTMEKKIREGKTSAVRAAREMMKLL